MKNTLFISILFCVFEANAQYSINFTGSGASTSVGSVIVENLTTGTSATVPSGYYLNLTFPTGVNTVENKQSSELVIYPNPTTGISFFRVYPHLSGEATISVFDMNGKQVAQSQNYLGNYLQEFRLSGLNKGVYVISVKGNTYKYSGKLMSNAKSAGTISIEKTSIINSVADQPSDSESKGFLGTKGSQPYVIMAYTSGDRLKFTGISGIYKTIMIDIPTGNKTLTFNFITCTDADNISYPVVAINTQIWMGENLKTSKYRNGDLIGTTDPLTVDIQTVNAPKYQWPSGGVESNVAAYGRLYTWFTINDSRNVCPTGWHVPTDAEWTTLTTYLGGEIVAGGKLKETGLAHWALNEGTTNESGFTSIPGGCRYYYGVFNLQVCCADYWWSATEVSYNLPLAFARSVIFTHNQVTSQTISKHVGYSVRCLKDN